MENLSQEQSTSTKNMYIVIGTDTYLGSHVMRYLEAQGEYAFGYTQNEDFRYDSEMLVPSELVNMPDNSYLTVTSEWLIVCLDPAMGFEKYITKMRQLCTELKEKEFVGDICFLSSASLYDACSLFPISENAPIYVRNDYDLALTTGENMLTVLASCDTGSYAAPHVIRIGVPYGNETDNKNSVGFVNTLLEEAKNGNAIRIPLLGDTKRTFTHIDDICGAVTALTKMEACPLMVNIPGEDLEISKAARAISQKYNVNLTEKTHPRADDQDYYPGNLNLSRELFDACVSYREQYTFSGWLERV